MKTKLRVRWNLTPKQAAQLQLTWRQRVVGHRSSLESAVNIVTQCVDRFRIPKPTREADHWVGEMRWNYQDERNREVSLIRQRTTSGVS